MTNEVLPPDHGGALVAAPAPAFDVQAVMQKIIDTGVTGEAVAVMKDLMAMQERIEERRAEQEFNAAYARMQMALPKIATTKPVPDKNGEIKYWYAEFDRILDIVTPIMQSHGFAASFNTRRDGQMLTAICTLYHQAGHSRANEFTIRVAGGPPGASDAQIDGSNRSYAKRYALTDALNLNIERGHDDDGTAGARNELNRQQRVDLDAVLDEFGAGRERAVKFALAATKRASLDEITGGQYANLIASLRARLKEAKL